VRNELPSVRRSDVLRSVSPHAGGSRNDAPPADVGSSFSVVNEIGDADRRQIECRCQRQVRLADCASDL
jgi:hypothetical protein